MASQVLCLSLLIGVCSVWSYYTFTPTYPPHTPLHSWKVPFTLTLAYLLSLPLLKRVKIQDAKGVLMPSMILYNTGQVLLNLWTVVYIVRSLAAGHPLVGDTQSTMCSYAVWVHYCDKYLEFLDTYFMVLRGRLDQVSFLHLYHHTTIAWAWWAGVKLYAEGDSYFGALLNSWIHVMMYSYYALTLCSIPCPWKKHLTICQLLQFASVMVYTVICFYVNNSKGQLESGHVAAMLIQVGEMASLFVLFSRFYKKSYRTEKKQKNEDMYNDECNTAIASGVDKELYADECQAAVRNFVTDPATILTAAATGSKDGRLRRGGG